MQALRNSGVDRLLLSSVRKWLCTLILNNFRNHNVALLKRSAATGLKATATHATHAYHRIGVSWKYLCRTYVFLHTAAAIEIANASQGRRSDTRVTLGCVCRLTGIIIKKKIKNKNKKKVYLLNIQRTVISGQCGAWKRGRLYFLFAASIWGCWTCTSVVQLIGA